jgi:DHA2 family multidrug resistance protein-like MFS transporter
VINAYQLAITVTLLPFASLGEIVGFRRVYQAGLILFTLASACCALSTSLPILTASRVLQGIGASAIMCVTGALLRFIWPHRMLGRGVGYNAMLVAVASAIGPTTASAVLAVGSWPWLFALNLPLGIVAIAVGRRHLPATPRMQRRFDWLSAGLNGVTLGSLILAVSGLQRPGGWPLSLAELVLALVCGALLISRQLGRTAPLLPIDLLRIPVFALSICTSVCSFASQMMAFTTLPFLLQNGLGRSAVMTGLLMTPWPAGVSLAAPLAGRLADRFSAGLLGGLGMLLMAAGLLLLSTMPAHPSNLAIIGRMFLSGVGFGLFQSPNNRVMLSSVPRERSGGASGMLATARLLGQSVGAALAAVAFGLSAGSGHSIALKAAAGFACVAMILSSLRMTSAGRQS